jgi:hypothetical protein
MLNGKPIPSAKILPPGGNAKITGAYDNKTNVVTWDKKNNNLFGEVKPGETATIYYQTAFDPVGAGGNADKIPQINHDKSYWTKGGTKVDGAFGDLGTPASIRANDFALNNVNFGNPSTTTTVTYQNIRVYIDNNISNFNIDSFDVPTGTQILNNGRAFAPITLTPGQNQDLPLSGPIPISRSGYELVLADAVDPNYPSVVFPVASAIAPAPEPMSVITFACGSMCMAGYGWRRLNRARRQSPLD